MECYKRFDTSNQVLYISPYTNEYCIKMSVRGIGNRGWRIGLSLVVMVLLMSISGPALADNPSELAMTLSKRADDLVAQERYTEAIVVYNEAIALDPYSSTIWNRLGIAEMNAGRYPDAVVAFQRALDLDPYYAKAWRNKGDALQAQGEFQASNEAYDRALTINSNDLHAILQKGINLQNMGRSDQAMEAYNEVIRLAEREVRRNPNEAQYDATLWANKGEALARLGRFEEALGSYQTAVHINPKYERALTGVEYVNETLFRAKVSPESIVTPIQPKPAESEELPIPLSPFSMILAWCIVSSAAVLRVRISANRR